MMGFNLEVAQGRSIAIKPTKPHGAPTTINLEELLAAKPADRAKWLKEKTDQARDRPGRRCAEGGGHARGRRRGPGAEGELRRHAPGRSGRGHGAPAVRRAPPVGLALHAADPHRADRRDDLPADPGTPRPEPHARTDSRPEGLRPGHGLRGVPRRRLPLPGRPVGEGLARPQRACRRIPPDEDEILHARRIVAQRCLYGVDKNPMAVDLAKLSLWLATLAKDHPFTFLDHALRCGDSLVGLSKPQIVGFHWKPRASSATSLERPSRGSCNRAASTGGRSARRRMGLRSICSRQKLHAADGAPRPAPALRRPRDLGFLRRDNDRQRKELDLDASRRTISRYQRSRFRRERQHRLDTAVAALRIGSTCRSCRFIGRSSSPRCSTAKTRASTRSWVIRHSAGKNTMSAGHAAGYPDWLKDDPRGIARQRGPCRALLPPLVQPASPGRSVWPDRD